MPRRSQIWRATSKGSRPSSFWQWLRAAIVEYLIISRAESWLRRAKYFLYHNSFSSHEFIYKRRPRASNKCQRIISATRVCENMAVDIKMRMRKEFYIFICASPPVRWGIETRSRAEEMQTSIKVSVSRFSHLARAAGSESCENVFDCFDWIQIWISPTTTVHFTSPALLYEEKTRVYNSFFFYFIHICIGHRKEIAWRLI